MSHTKPSISRCLECGETFGFPVEFCVFCGVAQPKAQFDATLAAAQAPASGPTGLAAVTPFAPSQPVRPDAKDTARAAVTAPHGASVEANLLKNDGRFGTTGQVKSGAQDDSFGHGLDPGRGADTGMPAAPAEPSHGAIIAVGLIGLALLAGIGFFVARPKPLTSGHQPAPPLRLGAFGRSEQISFVRGRRISWTYPVCLPPAQPACLDLVASGQERFPLGGTQVVVDGRVSGHYTFHSQMVAQFTSSSSADVNVEISIDSP
jgi:hypothetical protein